MSNHSVMLSCVIINDNDKSVSSLVAEHPNLELLFKAESLSAVSNNCTHSIDVVLLNGVNNNLGDTDIKKSVMSNTDLVLIDNEIQKFDIFNTFKSVSFLEKPINQNKFNDVINIIDSNSKSQKQSGQAYFQNTVNHLFVKEKGEYIRVNTSDIVYVENDGNYVNIVTQSKTFKSYATIKQCYNKLPHFSFVRTHRKYIVAIEHILSINDGYLISTLKKIPISRANQKTVYQKLKNNGV
ncbi:MAG: LytR/AlgR family response regulator transcription factor [Bacteroidia bacterium]